MGFTIRKYKFFSLCLFVTTGFEIGFSHILSENHTSRPLSVDLPSMRSNIFHRSRSLRFLRSSGMILSFSAVPKATM